jgi:hypothetical protein
MVQFFPLGQQSILYACGHANPLGQHPTIPLKPVAPQGISIPARQVPLRRIAKPCSMDMTPYVVRRGVVEKGDQHGDQVPSSGLGEFGGHSQPQVGARSKQGNTIVGVTN